MTQRTAAHTAGGVEDAVSARLDAAALWALQGPGPLDVRTGVVWAPASPMLVTGTAATSPWAVTVNAGHVVGSKGSTNGPYYAANDGTVTVALTVPPTSNSRIDVIYAMQADSAAIVNADGSTAALLTVATGTPSATPAVPAIPSGAVALAQVLIASTAIAGTSGAGVTITDVRTFTSLRGTPIPVLSLADRNALTGYDGDQVYRLDTHMVETYNGTGWVVGAPTILNVADPAEATAASAGAMLKSAGTLITLTPGTWLVNGDACVRTTDVADQATSIIWNATTAAEVSGSRGCGSSVPLTTGGEGLVTRPVSITVTANTQVQVAVIPNGTSTLRLSSLAVSPPAWITATRIA